jgi:hypothetical protein
MKNIIKSLLVAAIAMSVSFAYAQDAPAPKMEKKEMKMEKKEGKREKKAAKKEMKMEKKEKMSK